MSEIVPTPRIYWVFIVAGALLAGSFGCSREHSAMKGAVKEPAAEVVERVPGGLPGATALDKCTALYEKRASAGSEDELASVLAEECRPYRDYRDRRAPISFVYGLFGAIAGMFIGMFVNRKLRDTGKLPGWVG